MAFILPKLLLSNPGSSKTDPIPPSFTFLFPSSPPIPAFQEATWTLHSLATTFPQNQHSPRAITAFCFLPVVFFIQIYMVSSVSYTSEKQTGEKHSGPASWISSSTVQTSAQTRPYVPRYFLLLCPHLSPLTQTEHQTSHMTNKEEMLIQEGSIQPRISPCKKLSDVMAGLFFPGSY